MRHWHKNLAIYCMALTTYKQKRSFSDTPEPTGGKPSAKELRFVIQKHDASRLHYDFRLEMEGVLKSWAVPKGPSTDPTTKRLAMMVEDHPYDYRDFEGIIPKGNYGAGTVIVWDEGTYTPIEEFKTKKEQEKHLLKQLKEGNLKIVLNGKKLKGEFALVRTNGMGENSWLLIKHKDKFASKTDITKKDKSVVSGKTIAKVAVSSDKVWDSNRSNKKIPQQSTSRPKTQRPPFSKGESRLANKTASKKTALKETASKETASKESSSKETASKKSNSKKNASKKSVLKESIAKKIANKKTSGDSPPLKKGEVSTKSKRGISKKLNTNLSSATKKPFPKTASPMLATLVNKPFDEPGWIYEIKWDGYRALAMCNKKEVNLISRNNKSFNDKFYPVYEAVKAWGIYGIIDGEIAVINDKGVTNFGSLQNWRSEADGELMYYVFDILWLDGHDLTELPLIERRKILKSQLPADGIIRMSENYEGSATDFMKAATDMGLEGFIAKKTDSVYVQGDRTRNWLKIKINKRHEVVIGGFTLNDGTSKLFSSLLVGVFENGRFNYTGKIGTGFTEKMQKEMMKLFKPLITKKVPFAEEPDYNKPSRFRPNPPHAAVTWLKPELVCEVSYAEITSDGVMRHPSFEGMREDKKAKDVTREIPLESASKSTSQRPPFSKGESGFSKSKNKTASSILRAPTNKDRKTLLNPTEQTQVKKINGHELKFSNLSKIYWPKEKFTKRDLLNYYYQVAPFILPYLRDRPQSLNRYPNGITGQSFYQKDVTGKAPDWIETMPYTTSEDEDKNYMLCNKEADLLYMVNLGCIEIHPWSSTSKKPDNPDWCLIDLDPGPRNTFDQVIKTAQTVKSILDAIGIEGYCKTSGSTGMHIYIPLLPKYTYDDSQLFGRWIATQVVEQLPDITSVERVVKKRRGKLYVDFLQNRPGATLAAPYSARPKPGATVSMPLHWDEVKKGLSIKDFTIKNAMERIKANGDIFKPVLGKGIDLKKVLNKLI
jgi:bifunctional non-homologous end joining protein LigD